jgi:hypothetical protein
MKINVQSSVLLGVPGKKRKVLKVVKKILSALFACRIRGPTVSHFEVIGKIGTKVGGDIGAKISGRSESLLACKKIGLQMFTISWRRGSEDAITPQPP